MKYEIRISVEAECEEYVDALQIASDLANAVRNQAEHINVTEVVFKKAHQIPVGATVKRSDSGGVYTFNDAEVAKASGRAI